MSVSSIEVDDLPASKQDTPLVEPKTQVSTNDISGANMRQQQEHRFHYKPLDRTKGALRLVRVYPIQDDGRVRCKIERHHISTVEYSALSYVWGSAEESRTILLSGQAFRVRRNLYAFLRHAAGTPSLTDTPIWIDAICINQGDLSEKNGHVRHMGDIYGGATKVIAWLGDGGVYIPNYHNLPRLWVCCESREADITKGVRHDCEWKVPAFSSWDFVHHDYWNRLWIAQELTLARRVHILWKGRFYDWPCLRKHLETCALRCRRHHERSSEPLPLTFLQTMSYVQKLPIARYFRRPRQDPLGNLVPRFCFHACQIGHDHVFALLSMASDGEKFEPDYSEGPISLLMRLLSFCYTSPATAVTSKIGSALGIDPRGAGIAVEILKQPRQRLAEANQSLKVLYQLVDPDPLTLLEDTDVLVQLPDTNLHLLFRFDKDEAQGINNRMYRFVARIDVLSMRVEQARGKFGSPQSETLDAAFLTGPGMKSLQQSTLQVGKSQKKGRLRCSWPAVVAIFDSSYSSAPPGRLEGRIRSWKRCSRENGHRQLKFVT